MLNMIGFPHLGIEMKEVGTGISIFGFKISYYGMLLALALVVGTGITLLIAKWKKRDLDEFLKVSIVTIFAGIVGARLFYVLLNLGTFRGHFGKILNFRYGGFNYYGAFLTALLVLFLWARLNGESARKIFDICVPGVAVGQAILCWGNYFNREGIGEYTDGLFAMKFPLEAARIAEVSDKMRNHIVTEDGVRYIQASPVFLFEFIWCLLIAVLLVVLLFAKKRNGEEFFVYVIGYNVGRFFFEGMKTERMVIPGTQLNVERILTFLIIVIFTAFYFHYRSEGIRRGRRRGKPFSKDSYLDRR